LSVVLELDELGARLGRAGLALDADADMLDSDEALCTLLKKSESGIRSFRGSGFELAELLTSGERFSCGAGVVELSYIVTAVGKSELEASEMLGKAPRR
jgi:hypothetical protein